MAQKASLLATIISAEASGFQGGFGVEGPRSRMELIGNRRKSMEIKMRSKEIITERKEFKRKSREINRK